MDHSPFPLNRRAFLGRYAGAIGTLALSHLLEQEQTRAGDDQPAQHALGRWFQRRSPGRATSVICLFQHGGPSQMDLFDPKPALTKHHGKPYPGQLEIHFDKQAGKLLGLAVPVSAAWPVGDGAQRARAAHVRDRRRPDAGALDDDRIGRSRDGLAA